MLGYCQLNPWKTNLSKILIKNTEHFIHENASENIIYEMAVILYRSYELNAYETVKTTWAFQFLPSRTKGISYQRPS